jgi:hypothetical protein
VTFLAPLIARFSGFMGSKLSGYLMIAALVACAGLYGLYRVEANRANAALVDLGSCAANIQRFDAAMQRCVATVNDFAVTAMENQQQANRALLRAELAEDAIKIVRDQAQKDIAKALKDAEGFRDETQCRALGDPLPDDFADWVFDAQGGN